MFLEILAEESPMTFERFMELSLFHPEYGYYSRGNLPGKGGDYITSPCVHPVFGGTLALQILEIYEILGRPAHFVIVEAGGAQGYLAKDILNYLSKKGYFFEYWIIEPFPAIRIIQEEVLAKFDSQVKWFEKPEDLPPFKGVFISNELFDSFPVHIIQKHEDELFEIWVEVKNKEVVEFLGEISDPAILERITPYLRDWGIDYRTEVCLSIENFYKNISKKLRKGAMITIDYGYPRRDYYSFERNRGTLLCYYRHKVVDNPYFKPGHVDITAHVDFTYLRELGEKYGLMNVGFTQQGSFLAGLGIEQVLFEISKGSWKDIEALKFLIFPQGLGSSHWVLIQGRFFNLSETPILKGFSLSNRLHLLF